LQFLTIWYADGNRGLQLLTPLSSAISSPHKPHIAIKQYE